MKRKILKSNLQILYKVEETPGGTNLNVLKGLRNHWVHHEGWFFSSLWHIIPCLKLSKKSLSQLLPMTYNTLMIALQGFLSSLLLYQSFPISQPQWITPTLSHLHLTFSRDTLLPELKCLILLFQVWGYMSLP